MLSLQFAQNQGGVETLYTTWEPYPSSYVLRLPGEDIALFPLPARLGFRFGSAFCRCLTFAAEGTNGHVSRQTVLMARVECHCTAKVPCAPRRDDEDEDDENDEGRRSYKLCNRKMTWRQAGTFPYYLSNNLTPRLYLKMLYYYASDADYQTCKRECGVKSKVWRLFVQKSRAILRLVVGQQQQQQLGGRDRIVAVDETFFTTKKRSRGGFRGRETAGHATLVLGMIELDLHTRRATGRCL